MLLYIAVGFTIFCWAGLLAWLLLSQKSHTTLQRLAEITQRGTYLHGARGRGQAVRTWLLALANRVRSLLGVAESASLRERFDKAGYKGSAPFDTYVAARVLGPIAALVAGSLISSNRMFAMISLAGIAYLAPDITLQRLIKRRREKIRRSISDAVDLLVICVDAGLGIDQAMLRVGQELGTSHPEITEEFLQINREQRAGKPRVEAWQGMAQRSELPDVVALVNMLLQTERFGTPIARALSNFADGIRVKRRQRAEELAAKTTVKIIFPLVLFIFPSMFIVLLGPAVLNIMRGFAGMAH